MWGFDDYDTDDDRDYGRDYEGGRVTRCKFCKSADVEWVHTAFGWELFNDADGSFHDCRKPKVTADSFDDLTKD